MTKSILTLILFFSLVACNNEKTNDDHQGHKKNVLKTPVDSLEHEVMEGHDAVMPKMGKIRGAQKKAQQMLDSIATLNNAAQEANTELKASLQSLINELSYADYAMDRWMTEYNMDSLKDNEKKRIEYLSAEKTKVNKVKQAVLTSLAKADSLFRIKN